MVREWGIPMGVLGVTFCGGDCGCHYHCMHMDCSAILRMGLSWFWLPSLQLVKTKR